MHLLAQCLEVLLLHELQQQLATLTVESLADVLQQPVRVSDGGDGGGGEQSRLVGGGKGGWGAMGKVEVGREGRTGGKGGKGVLLNGGFQATEAHATAAGGEPWDAVEMLRAVRVSEGRGRGGGGRGRGKGDWEGGGRRARKEWGAFNKQKPMQQ